MMNLTLKCLPGENILQDTYLKEHGCQISRKQLPDGTEYDEVQFPPGTIEDTLPIGGVLEPRYKITLPGGAVVIKYFLRQGRDLMNIGIPTADLLKWRAEQEKGAI